MSVVDERLVLVAMILLLELSSINCLRQVVVVGMRQHGLVGDETEGRDKRRKLESLQSNSKKGTIQRRECRIRKNVYNGNLEMNENFVNKYSNAF